MKKAFVIFLSAVVIIAAVAGFVSAADNAGGAPLPDGMENLFTPSPKPDGGDASPNLPGAEPSPGLPDVDIGEWNLKLVNADNPLSEDYQITTGVTSDGYLFDERAIDALDKMLADGRAEGLLLALNSAYRTYEYQNMLFENKVSRVMTQQGCGRAEAEEIAAEAVTRPGTSEHNLGLAVDIVSESYGTMDDGYAETPEAKWLLEHCAEYGFILRYPEDKQDITKIIYEPWHFRYVGVEAAEYMMGNSLCLEEFLKLYQ